MNYKKAGWQNWTFIKEENVIWILYELTFIFCFYQNTFSKIFHFIYLSKQVALPIGIAENISQKKKKITIKNTKEKKFINKLTSILVPLYILLFASKLCCCATQNLIYGKISIKCLPLGPNSYDTINSKRRNWNRLRRWR